ncbi:Rgg/GadR/MutR family transcriptional regulator [Streptococcus merionis]|uniref:MutR family positive transcriptional regulator n=1 Tax=Streptococcus merionis TaxID=400065 RepID=A0A239SVQ8_9STRE|nr:Rgg/GadR/MutR family transcriptional regulator [Streptococcus merionis]SNU88918.1 MutR family positive transcriptional regulator [Streptococcus merionis]
MTHYGAVFRRLRQNRNYSLKQIAGDELSLAQLSRFERGESDISLGKFFYALSKLQLTVADFMAVVHDNKNNDLVEFMAKLIPYDYERDIEGFKALQEQEQQKLEENPDALYPKLNRILVQGFICQYDETEQMMPEDLALVSDYLFCTEEWGMYEIILVGNLYVYYDMEQITRMVAEVLRNKSFYQAIGRHRNLVILTLLNVYMTSIERREFSQAERFRQELQSLLDNETQTYPRMIFLYLNGFYAYSKGDLSATAQMQQVIAMFDAIDSKHLANNYREHYEKWVTKSNS